MACCKEDSTRMFSMLLDSESQTQIHHTSEARAISRKKEVSMGKESLAVHLQNIPRIYRKPKLTCKAMTPDDRWIFRIFRVQSRLKRLLQSWCRQRRIAEITGLTKAGFLSQMHRIQCRIKGALGCRSRRRGSSTWVPIQRLIQQVLWLRI